VPHEVVGMAGYNKNIFVGTGGQEGINKSHFVGAAYGMERMMGRADTPVRKLLNYASEHFTNHLPIVYVLTRHRPGDDGKLQVRGLYIGDDAEAFKLAAALSLEVNFEMLDAPLKKVVVYLDPSEFKSTWLGNKAVYRTRMAMADRGELIILAPGLKEFGEDQEIDRLIRKYGYFGTPRRSPPSRPTRSCATTSAPPRTSSTARAKVVSASPTAPATSRSRRSKARQFPLRRLEDDDAALRSGETEGRLEHAARRRKDLLHLQPRPRPLGLDELS
jgi:hypothetical protein